MKIKTESLDSTISKGFNKTSWQTVKMALRPYRKNLFILFTVGIAGRFFTLYNSIVIGKWIDSFCQGSDCKPSSVFWSQMTHQNFLEILFLITSLGFFLTLFFRVQLTQVLTQSLATVYDEVTLRTSRFPMSFFDENPVGKVVTRFSSDYMNIMRVFGGAVAEFASIALDLFLIIFLIGMINVYFLPVVFLIGVLNFYVYIKSRQSLLTQRQKTSNLRSPGIAHFAETLQGAHLIRLHNKKDIFTDRFERLDLEYQNEKRKSVFKMTLFSFKMNSLSLVMFAAISILSYKLIQSGYATIGAVGAALTLILLSSNTIQIFFEWLSLLEEALVSFERFNRLMYLPLELGGRLPSSSRFETNHDKEDFKKPEIPQPAPEGAQIHVQNLWFRYKEDLPWVLKGLSFHILPGERVGLVGKTGSGKSSLIKALYYLYPLDQGSIVVNHCSPQLTITDIENGKIPLNQYRSLLSLIPQDPVLFCGTLRENIDPYGEATTEDLEKILCQVKLSKKLNTVILERGSNLSQGEKQLVALARCLLMRSPIVIMDEATSAVDPMTEEILKSSLETFLHGRTQLIIAHRLSTLEKCDRIMIMKNGLIETIGSPQELIPQIQKEHLLF